MFCAQKMLGGSLMALFCLLVLTTITAQAQVDLAITQSDAGVFAAGPSANCSAMSPQYTNIPDFARSGNCVQTKRIWVTNLGTAATNGVVTVRDFMTPEQPKGSTVLSTNGYCAQFQFGCAIAPQAANGWACVVFQGSLSCSRSDSLAPGKSYSPIVVKLLREDYSPLICFNDLANVSGGTDGGLVDTNLANNTSFDDSISWPLNPPLGRRETGITDAVTVHSVPEGLGVSVDGSLYKTPHTFYWKLGELHTILVDNNGVPWPGNEGWSPVLVSTDGVGISLKNSQVWWSFPIVAAGLTPYEQITVVYTK